MGGSGPALARSKYQGRGFVMKGRSGRLEWDKHEGLRQKAGGAEQDSAMVSITRAIQTS